MINKIQNWIKKTKRTYFLFSFFLLIILVGFFVFKSNTRATGNTEYLSGYAWSDTIGWISFSNCTDPSTSTGCTGIPYQVTYDDSNNPADLDGYAWSSNVGWIHFVGTFPSNASLPDLPPGSTNAATAQGSKITQVLAPNPLDSRISLTGWARATSPTPGGDGSCPSFDQNPDGCWDGWISLSGNNYGVQFLFSGDSDTTSSSTHFAWGSDVLGWVDFSNAKIVPTPVVPVPSAINSFTFPSCVTTTDGIATLSWSTTGMASCTISSTNPNSSTPVAVNSPAQGQDFSVSAPATSFTLTCLNSSGTIYSSPNKVSVQISCTPPAPNKKPGFKEI